MRKLTYLSLLLVGGLTASAADMEIKVGGGTGTETDPYIISAPEHLTELATACNDQGTTAAANSHFSGKYFKMTNDIDMKDVEGFIGIGTAAFGKTGSNTNYYFDGIWDGGGYTIKNMQIKGATFTDAGLVQSTGRDSSRQYIGLFGTLGEYAVVKNLNLDASCSVEAFGYVGSIAGYMKAKAATTTGSNPGPASAALVSNCTSAATVTAYGQYSGGIVGYATRSNINHPVPTIENCYFSGTSANNYASVGGILGYGSRAEVRNCVNTGQVLCYFINAQRAESTSRNIAGGIVGNSQYGEIKDCLNAGRVFIGGNNGHTAGGIAGTATRNGNGTSTPYSGRIDRCVNIGVVDCKDLTRKGMLVGLPGTSLSALVDMSDNYFDAQISAAMADGVGYNGTQFEITGATGLSTKEMTSGSALEGLDATVWKFAAGFYPRLAAIDTDMVNRAAATYFVMPDGVNASNFIGEATISTAMSGITATVADAPSITVAGDKITASAPSSLVDGTITLTNGDFTMAVPVMQIPRYWQGEGTEASPYLISSKTDIMNLMNSVNGTELNHYEDTYFRMTADIDMENDTTFIGIGAKFGDSNAQNTHFFSGVFDGDNHVIKNLRINVVGFNANGTVASAQSVTNSGFFGTLGATAFVKNINFDSSCSITGYTNTGTLAGYAIAGAKVENVSSAATIKTYSNYAGGIIARAIAVTAKDNPDTTACTITKALFTGKINANGNYVGGIIGYNQGIVRESVNTGEINAYKSFGTASNFTWVGGIAGDNLGNIYDCANYGPIYGAGQVTSTAAYGRVGGIAGEVVGTYYRGELMRTFNSGGVISDPRTAATCGAVAGSRATTGATIKIENNWYDAQLASFGAVLNAAADGNNGLNTAALTAGTAIEGLGDKFTFTAGYYPIPTAWAQNETVKRAAAIYFTLPEGQTISDFKTEGVIATTMPLTATLANGTVFKIDAGKVIAGATEEIAADTLTLVNGTVINRYALMKIPPVLPGSGTQADPWQIATPEDFVKAANYLVDANYNFEGEYVKLMNDLDFTGKEFIPMGTTTLSFEGYFDGNGKTVKNLTFEDDPENKPHHIALFTNLGENGVIDNLKLSNVKITAYGYVAGIASVTAGTIKNIEIDAQSEIKGIRQGTATGTNQDGSYVGAIAAQAKQGAKFENCINRAPVSTTRHYAGGIVGQVVAAGTGVAPTAYIRDCANYGNVVSTAIKEATGPSGAVYVSARVGGIAGFMAGEVTRCVNEGNVTVATADRVGGLTGDNSPGTLFTDCVNRGNVTAANNMGGIAGFSSDPAGVSFPAGFIRCTNYGNVTAGDAESTQNGMYAGGIAGQTGKNWNYIDCSNHGDITTPQTGMSYGHHLAGIVAQVSAGTSTVDGERIPNVIKFTRCYNTGHIQGVNSLAGIIGYTMNGMSQLDSCFNTGSLTQISVNSQGEPAKPTMAVCSGIAGGFNKFTNCYNAGEINGWTGAGMGYGLADVTAENCFNMGKFEAIEGANKAEFQQIFINQRDGMEAKNCYALTQPGFAFADDEFFKVNSVDSLGLVNAAEKLGPAFVANTAAFPMIAGLDTVPEAQFVAAWYLLAEGDTPTNVTMPVTLANLSHVVWTSNDLFKIENGIATPTGKGESFLTATTGEMTKTYALTAAAGDPEDITVDGINYHLDLENLRAIVVKGDYTGVIDIPETVTSVNKVYTVVGIDASAFQNTTVTSLSIPKTMESMGNDACRNMRSLKTVITPSIADWVKIEFANGNANPIYNAGELTVGTTPVGTTLTIPEGIEAVSNYSFKGLNKVESVVFPTSLKSLGDGVFNGCTSLKSAHLPAGCTIGTGLFFGCSALNDVELPEGITEIPQSTFYGCEGLTEFTVPEGVTTIGSMAFSGCSGLTEVTLPASVTSVGMMAFSSCSAVTAFYSKATTPPAAQAMAFDEMNFKDCVLYVQDGSVDAYKAAEEWKQFNNILIDTNSVDGIAMADVVSVSYYTMDGREIAEPAKGTLVVAVYTLADGRREARKIVK